jgi:acyl-CoA dehydrogenase
MALDFRRTPEQERIRASVARLCEAFGDDYWLARDRDGAFPHDFHAALAAGGWLGISLPEAYGGSGLGLVEAAIMMQVIAESGAGFSGASAVHMNIFGLAPVAKHGTPEQRQRMLPPIVRGTDRACFAVTEPDAGLDTTRLTTRAERRGERYVVHGRKVWISTAQVANKMLLLARTAAPADAGSPAGGLTLFYTDFDRRRIEVREIDKMGRKAVDSNSVYFDGLEIPVEDRIGAEGQGFRLLLDGFNPERVLIAAEAVGLGRAALRRATAYARERVVFGRSIGRNQGIQHPLAERWIELEAADLMMLKAAVLHDAGEPCGAAANAAKFLGAEAGYRACETALLTHGGMGYAKDYHVERYLREAMIPRLAPVSAQLVLCYLAERVLGLPKSY